MHNLLISFRQTKGGGEKKGEKRLMQMKLHYLILEVEMYTCVISKPGVKNERTNLLRQQNNDDNDMFVYHAFKICLFSSYLAPIKVL